MDIKQSIAEKIVVELERMGQKYDRSVVYSLLETPRDSSMGDVAFPCFTLAKTFRQPPQAVAIELANGLRGLLIHQVQAVGAYVNVFLDKPFVSARVLADILEKGAHYGDANIGEGGRVPIDLSSPNIAKPFSMGHLRSTVIGNALANILAKCGYQPVRINHLGDWGTQFGKLMAAYVRWGEEAKVKTDPIQQLLGLYVRFHKEAEANTALEEEGRAWFKKLENGDEEAERLWQWFRDESLQAFNHIYGLLGITFDSYDGEAFYNDKMDEVVCLLREQGLLTLSDGAQVVQLEEYDLPPCLIKKSDGATLYATRDLAAALYRYRQYGFTKALYVVGHEQRLHFQQLFCVLTKMGYDWAQQMEHVPFGLMLQDGKKMSTRKGKAILLEDVLKQAIAKVEQHIACINPGLANKANIARQVGVGAVIFHDLKNDRNNDIVFSMDDMLAFEGETGPYVQYTHARIRSLLRKGGWPKQNGSGRETEHTAVVEEFNGPKSWAVVTTLMKFPTVVQRAHDELDPSAVGKYVIDLAQAFNKYYGSVRILSGNDREKGVRLQLTAAVAIVLKEGLRLLGIEAPEEM